MTMTSDRDARRDSSIEPVVFMDEPHSFVDWGAILGGAILATAVATLLLVFGSALGLSLTSAYPGRGVPATGLVMAGALWVLWVEVSCFFAGGYLAGRLRRRINPAATPHEVEVRDGSHGLLVWALCLVVGALVAGAAVSGVASLGATAVGGATAAASEPAGYYVDALLRPSAATTPSPAEPSTGGTEAQPTTAGEAAETTTTTIEADRQSIGRIFAMNAAGSFDPDDKAYIAQVVSARTGLPPEEASKRVDDVIAKARAAAEQARKYGILVAFLYAASMLVSALAAWWSATLGGRHRDGRADYSHLFASRP